MNYFLILLSFICHGFQLSNSINIWGPGLKPELIVLPARYFFIQSSNASEYLSVNNVIIKIQGVIEDESRQCRIWTNVLHTTDNILLVRYKLYEVCYHVKIDILSKIDQSSLIDTLNFIGPVYPDDISCPSPSIEEWREQYECRQKYPNIEKDLKKFPSINFDEIHEGAEKMFHHPASMSVCNYVVKNNEIYRRCYGQHTGFKMFMDNLLLSLTRKVHLPDLEFWSNLGDWPLAKSDKYPMFSWCGSDETYDVIMPTYDITESTLENMGRVSLDLLSVQGNIKKTWKNKESKIFWRGRDSNRVRLKLIDIAREHPNLFNASLTNFFFFKDEEVKYGPKEKHVSFFDFFDYKYQLNLDGTVAAYRFPYLLVGDSVVFKQDSKYYEYFYSEIKPWEHYIPVKTDLSDLMDRLKWALENEHKVLKIIETARSFVRNNLMPNDIICYHAVLFHEWSKRIKNKIKVRDGMESVSQKNVDVPNPCLHKNKIHEEF